jgi:phosphatidylserine/phosphatidylglycerophosphate/cardiolipin synthase-like enzyme
MKQISTLVGALFLMMSFNSAASIVTSPPDFELVYTAPLETSLTAPDLRDPVTVWCEMFDAAKLEIVVGQFYVAGKPGEALDKVIFCLDAAGRRGVKIRFLMEERGKLASESATITQLKAIPNLEFKILEFAKIAGEGIIHAKYIVVDNNVAYVGSQNFDWRSLTHIHELGLRITNRPIVQQLQAIFDVDWQAQTLIAQGKPVPILNHSTIVADTTQSAYLVASPNAYNPVGVADSETELIRLLATSKSEVLVQLLDYAPLSYGPNRTRPYYAKIDNAIRSALARKVRVKLMVSNWNTDAPAVHYLQSLAVLPGIEIKIVTLPEAAFGFIPFARVIHTKSMSIDGQIAWIGTSNWGGGYLDNSRNMEVVIQNEALAKRIAQLHEQLWTSRYARPIDVLKSYPRPRKN